MTTIVHDADATSRFERPQSRSSATATRAVRGRSTCATAASTYVCVRGDETARAGRRRRLRHGRARGRERRRRDVRPRPRRRDPVAAAPPTRRRAGRSSRAATRSRSIASTRPATSAWSRRACSGPEVRRCYEEGVGFITAVGVHRDVTGPRRPRTLAVAKAIGGLRQGAIELTPRQEAVLDLAVEQVLSPALQPRDAVVRRR